MKNRQWITTLFSLSIVVIVLGVFSIPLIEKNTLNTLRKMQIDNNRQQAERFVTILKIELDKGRNPEEIRQEFQQFLTLYPQDESGFVCMLGEDSKVLCHPNDKMINMPIGHMTRMDADENKLTMDQVLSTNSNGGGLFEGGKQVQIVYQLLVPGTNWLMSVHTNYEIIQDETDKVLKSFAYVTIPTIIVLILLGTFAVRKTSHVYEDKLIDANHMLEVKVIERTKELQETIYELQLAREELVQSEKMSLLGQLVAGITHEINNPLNVIIGNAGLLHHKSEDEQTNKLAHRIMIAGDRCSRLVKNLLSFARKEPLEFHHFELDELIDTVSLLLEVEISKYNIEIDSDIPEEFPSIYGDKLQIEQIFFNLMKNAIQAMGNSAPARISIQAVQEGSWAIIKVEDNGSGIPPQALEHIFDAFHTSKGQSEGTGLGLSLCQQFIQAHGGKIDVKSYPDRGTEFTITLPL